MNHPIESIIPEIWLHIAEWLDIKQFRKCVLVTKAWNTTFTPYLWRNFALRNHSITAPTLATVKKNALSVRCLNTANLPRKLLDIEFQHLQQLTIGRNLHKSQRGADWESIYGLLRRSASTLRSVTVVIRNDPVPSTFWYILQSCPMLEKLLLDRCVIDLTAAPAFLDVCTRVKTIQLSKISLQTKTANSENSTLATNPFASAIILRKLQDKSALKLFVPFLFGCPNLKRMELSCTEKYIPTTIPNPHEIAILPRPYLTQIYLENVSISEVSMTTLLDSIPLMVLRELYLSTNGLGLKALTSLRRHCQSIEHLHIQQCPTWTSQQFIRILTSFPRLLTVKAPYICARDVAACLDPWVCTDLYKFCAYVDTSHSPTTKDALQASLEMQHNERVMFGALGRLIKLRTLDISLIFGYNVAVSNGRHPLDLQLSSGLDALAELNELRVLDCRETNQVMSAEDIAWIGKHWPKLARVRGEIVYTDGDIEDAFGSIGVEYLGE
ncbi:hypothetical protein BGZ93_011456 [Podila epicladia]|nr:hypothetical protein BGZ93_011456 [Podila epicladia]